jgi:hypothetical protein
MFNLKRFANTLRWNIFRISIDIWILRTILMLFSRDWSTNSYIYFAFKLELFYKDIINIRIEETWEHKKQREVIKNV